jgi:nicotinamidase-related amidase
MQVNIPIRYYRDYPGAYDYGYDSLELPLAECAFLAIDIDGAAPNQTSEKMIAPALGAARDCGMRVAYVHNDLSLVANKENIAGEVWRRTKGGGDVLAGWRDAEEYRPEYLACVAPQPGEPDFPKWIWSGFHDTFLDQYLRSCGVRTLFVAGYSRRACLHYTCAEAVGRNYRVILLRDCSNAPGELEMPDTRDAALPEGGWVQRIVLRNFEHLIGYTTTRDEFLGACRQTKKE